MIGKLYVIGIGPGDPELLTLKAVRILERVPTLCVPKGREEGTSLALSIVSQAVNLDGTDIIEAHFPMRKTRGQKTEVGSGKSGDISGKWEVGSGKSENDSSLITHHPSLSWGSEGTVPEFRAERSDAKDSGRSPDPQLAEKWEATAQEIIDRLEQGTDVAFITLGDPTIYCTYFYLHATLRERMPDLVIEFIPGITSVTAAAARAGMSLGLGDEKIAILPATYAGDIRTVLAEFDTVVLMKVHSVLDRIMPVLKELQLEDACVYVARAGMPDERIIRDIAKMTADDLNYFSILMIRTGRKHNA